MELYRFFIFGRVQGVFYRKFVSSAAMKRQFRGYVKNLADGSVEVVVELTDEDLEEFMRILKEGSPLSTVENISYEAIADGELVYDGFEIRY